jgi:glucokinase
MPDVLAADIGGTNSRFARFRAEEGGLELVDAVWLSTSAYGSFSELMGGLGASGLSLRAEDADIAALAVAGPVERGVYSAPPLIPWDIDLSDAAAEFGLRRAVLVNDFVAQAYATQTPVARAARAVLEGRAVEGASVAVIGAGTGMGKAALLPDGCGGYVALPSEGGHADFPFEGEWECEYQRFLLRELGEEYATYNHVVSGRGLSLLHLYLTGERLSPDEVAMKAAPAVLERAARFYGRACRNFALETLALGGLYIAGGVAARNPSVVRHPAFAREFHSSSTHARLLRGVPVYLMADENSGLWGAAYCGLQALKKY